MKKQNKELITLSGIFLIINKKIKKMIYSDKNHRVKNALILFRNGHSLARCCKIYKLSDTERNNLIQMILDKTKIDKHTEYFSIMRSKDVAYHNDEMEYGKGEQMYTFTPQDKESKIRVDNLNLDDNHKSFVIC